MPYISFTNEQKEQANNVDLVDFLKFRGEKLQRIGREFKLIYYNSSGKHDSITISGSRWFDHKSQVGGGAIKFMQTFYDMDFPIAVQSLLGMNLEVSYTPKTASERKIEEPKAFVLPEKNSDMHRVYAYLIKQRFISPNIITHFAKKHLIYEDKDHHNAVFVGVDEENIPRQAHKRSTNSFGQTFRITCEGSDTKYSFAHFGTSNLLYVFEAPIDMLSYLTLNPQSWQKHSYIAMNGVYESAVLTALKSHSNLSEIVLCTDNDEGGIDAVDRLTDILVQNGFDDISRLSPKFKDWNEDLKAINGLEPQNSVAHQRKDLFCEVTSNLQFFECNNSVFMKISQTYKNEQYKFLAEIALAFSAFLLSKSDQGQCFEMLKTKLYRDYRAYGDKSKMQTKKNNLSQAMKNFNANYQKSSRTSEQTKLLAKCLFEVANQAVKCEVEQELIQEKCLKFEENGGYKNVTEPTNRTHHPVSDFHHAVDSGILQQQL